MSRLRPASNSTILDSTEEIQSLILLAYGSRLSAYNYERNIGAIPTRYIWPSAQRNSSIETLTMKTPPLTPLALAAFLTAVTTSPARANIFTNNFETSIVAEKTKEATDELTKPTTYVAFDGGYIEAGDPESGDEPPSATQVRQSLEAALAAQGFQESDKVPKLLITYHWGVLRIDTLQIHVPFEVRQNLSARISLVSTQKMDAEIENHILDRERGNGENLNVSSPRFLTGELESVVSRARRPRIFVVVSAYDYQSLFGRHVAKLIWTTKLSAQETSGDMVEVIPPMLAKGTGYFGTDSPNVIAVGATLVSKASSLGAPASPEPSPEYYHLDPASMAKLLAHDREEITGESK